jgi:heme exporter protein B
MTLFLRQAWIIAAKDLRAEFRTKETLNASLAFAVTILLLFSFAVDVDPERIQEICGGLLWMVFAFAGALLFNRAFSRDLANDCLDALIASPVPTAALLLGKAVSSFVLVFLIELLCYPVFGLLYNINWTRQLPLLLAVTALATWAMAIIGAMFSALTVNLSLREIMLPLLVYPVLIPALMAAMLLTTHLIGQGTPIPNELLIWVRVLAAFDIIFTALSLSLVEYVLVG